MPDVEECYLIVLFLQCHEKCVEEVDDLRQEVEIRDINELPGLWRCVALGISEVPHIASESGHSEKDFKEEVGIDYHLEQIFQLHSSKIDNVSSDYHNDIVDYHCSRQCQCRFLT